MGRNGGHQRGVSMAAYWELSMATVIELAFTDRAGVHWRRTALGGMKQIKKAPPDYYDLPLPRDWASPEELRPSSNSDA